MGRAVCGGFCFDEAEGSHRRHCRNFSKAGDAAVSQLELTLNTLLYLLPCLILYFVTFRGKLHRSRLFWPLSALLSLVTLGVTLFLFSPLNPFRDWTLVYSFLYLSAVLALCRLVTDRPLPQILFVLLFLCCCTDDIAMLCALAEPAFQRLSGGAGFLLAHCVILAAALPLLWMFVERNLRPGIVAEQIMPYWRMLWIVPATFYILYRININPGLWMPGNVPTWQENMGQPAWIAGTFLCHYVILRMLAVTIRDAELLERLHISDVQLALQKEQYCLLRENIEYNRRSRHDMRHHMLVLKRYLDEQNGERLTEYINQFLETSRFEEYAPLCENPAVDAIAQHYAGIAKECGAAVELALALPDELPVPESDVCVVLGNLLENAVEACRSQESQPRFLHVKAAVIGSGAVVVKARNSYSHEIRCKNGVFCSSKRDGEGIGIQSVRNVAQRYNGLARFDYAGGVFEASVLLNPRTVQTACGVEEMCRRDWEEVLK